MYLFNSPHYFVKGIAEQRVTSLENGDLLARETILSDAASEISDSLDEIIGFENRLVGMLPGSRRITGSYTAQSFSLEAKQLALGGNLGYNGISSVCEEVTADSEGKLYVSRLPAVYYGQTANESNGRAYVRTNETVEPNDPANTGTNVGVALEETSGKGYLVGYVGVSSKVYTVTYFTRLAAAKELAIPDVPALRVFTVEQIFGVYAKQHGSFGEGVLTHKLHIIYPYAQFTSGGGVSGSQTAITTSDGTWQAISPDEYANGCTDCGFAGTGAYYVLVPCTADTSAITGLAVVGGGVTVQATKSVQIPVKFVMDDNSVIQPDYSDMTYVSAAEGTATVSESGVVSGVAAGSTVVTITLKADNTKTTTCAVTVTA